MRLLSAAVGLMVSLGTLAARGDDAPTADAGTGGGIQWFATWEQGLADAKRTGRPILLVAAAPQCHDAPGVW